MHNLVLQVSEIEKQVSALISENAKLKDQLALKDEEKSCLETDFNTFKAEAKEIIKKFLLWENDWHDKTESKHDLLKQAEQFLNSEV